VINSVGPVDLGSSRSWRLCGGPRTTIIQHCLGADSECRGMHACLAQSYSERCVVASRKYIPLFVFAFVMAPTSLDCELATFLKGVKGSEVSGRVEKAVAVLSDPKVEVCSPGDLVGCKAEGIVQDIETKLTSGTELNNVALYASC